MKKSRSRIHATHTLDTDRRLRAAVRHDPVAGHHAFGAEFDPDAPIRLAGQGRSSSGSTRMPGSISK